VTRFNPGGIVITRPSWEITSVLAGMGVAVGVGAAVGDVATIGDTDAGTTAEDVATTAEGVCEVGGLDDPVAVLHPARANMPIPTASTRFGVTVSFSCAGRASRGGNDRSVGIVALG
jgi:hypothetical protein